MNQTLIWPYIEQRMRELGFTKYSIEPFTVRVPDNGEATIRDDGQYYYLCWVYRNVFPTILGATITISSAEQSDIVGNYVTWSQASGIELKGQIKISATGFGEAITVEFLRVTID